MDEDEDPEEDRVTVTFLCKTCGGGTLEIADDADDSSIVKCKQCGTEIGTWGDVKAEGRKAVIDRVTSAFDDTFKRR